VLAAYLLDRRLHVSMRGRLDAAGPEILERLGALGLFLR